MSRTTFRSQVLSRVILERSEESRISLPLPSSSGGGGSGIQLDAKNLTPNPFPSGKGDRNLKKEDGSGFSSMRAPSPIRRHESRLPTSPEGEVRLRTGAIQVWIAPVFCCGQICG